MGSISWTLWRVGCLSFAASKFVAAKMAYDEKVKKKLGRAVRDSIIDSVHNGTIDSAKMKDIAFKLHEHVGGRHVIRTISGGKPCDSVEMRAILCDWWAKDLCRKELSREEAVQKLVNIFEHNDLGLRPLADQLKNIMEREERDSGYRVTIESRRPSIRSPGNKRDTTCLSAFAKVVKRHKKMCISTIAIVVIVLVIAFVIFPALQPDDPSGTTPGYNSTTESPESSSLTSTSTTTTTATTTTTTPDFMTISPFYPTETVPHMPPGEYSTDPS